MKKNYFLFFTLITASLASSAQTFPNAGFETWRSGTSASHTIYAPAQWYGLDSLILGEGATFAFFLHPTKPWDGSAQLFQENTIVHSGASSAKLITLKQDTLGFFPGVLSNAQSLLNTTEAIEIFTSGTGNPEDAVTFFGGTPVSSRINTVSAWVEYMPGIDSTGAHGNDTGLLEVQAISYISGQDSVVGSGTLKITPTGSSFFQITDTIVYTDLVNVVDTIRVVFASSGGAAKRLDSSTLYVDDVSMTSFPEAVQTIPSDNNFVKIYPNPANTILNFGCASNADLTCQLYAISGQAVMNQHLSAQSTLDISDLVTGMYFYTITNNNGNIVQRGKVSLIR